MDFRERFTIETKYICYDDDINQMAAIAYGKTIEIQAEEESLYGSSIERTAYEKWKYDSDKKSFDGFIETGKYPGTDVLLTALCMDGYIDKGEYVIRCGN